MSIVIPREFAVVSFDDGTVSVISSSWLHGQNQCYWPADGNTRKQAKKHAAVGEGWTLHTCKIMTTSGVFLQHFCIIMQN